MEESKRRHTFLLRLPESVRDQATELARIEGISLNHFVSLAVAEKLVREDALAARRNERHQLIMARPALRAA